MNYDGNFYSYYNSLKKRLDEEISNYLRKEKLSISETPLSGKRIRGVLLLLVFQSLSNSNAIDKAIPGAIAIELAHAASLDIDDMIDKDKLRRGKPTSWVRLGHALTALVSHSLVAKALELIVNNYGLDAVKEFSETYSLMTSGELLEKSSELGYEEIIYRKTASLFGCASAIGAIAASKREYKNLAKSYGISIGMAYQIADDIVDVSKNSEKEPIAGKFLDYLGISRADPTNIESKIYKSGVQKVEYWVKKAQEYANKFPENEYKAFLKIYPEFAVKAILSNM